MLCDPFSLYCSERKGGAELSFQWQHLEKGGFDNNPMPKTTKRTATKRAARIAKAHATQLPPAPKKSQQAKRPAASQKAPTRGLARYPWLISIVLLLIALGVSLLYFNHIGPFALPPAKPKTAAVSPCVSDNVVKQITNTTSAPDDKTFNATRHKYDKAPDATIDNKKIYCAGINTNQGLIVVELDPKLAPNTVNNFVFLAQNHYFDGMVFHRVIQDGSGAHIIQTGDPLGKDAAKRGSGTPGYSFNDEAVQGDYTEGTIAMANSGANSNGSQFFINTSDNSKLLVQNGQKKYNLFGHVVKGIDIAKKIQGPRAQNDPDYDKYKNTRPDVMNHVVVVAA